MEADLDEAQSTNVSSNDPAGSWFVPFGLLIGIISGRVADALVSRGLLPETLKRRKS